MTQQWFTLYYGRERFRFDVLERKDIDLVFYCTVMPFMKRQDAFGHKLSSIHYDEIINAVSSTGEPVVLLSVGGCRGVEIPSRMFSGSMDASKPIKDEDARHL